jgi:hypothetical protein
MNSLMGDTLGKDMIIDVRQTTKLEEVTEAAGRGQDGSWMR